MKQFPQLANEWKMKNSVNLSKTFPRWMMRSLLLLRKSLHKQTRAGKISRPCFILTKTSLVHLATLIKLPSGMSLLYRSLLHVIVKPLTLLFGKFEIGFFQPVKKYLNVLFADKSFFGCQFRNVESRIFLYHAYSVLGIR